MFKELNVSIKGVSPLLTHNIQLADPMNQWTKALKEISSKRKKTETDFAEMSRIEWYGGLYVNSDKRIILPSEVLFGSICGGAKKSKLGKQFLSGFDVVSDSILEYDGDKNIDKLWKSGKSTDIRAVSIQRARIMRTRPIFFNWSVTIKCHFMEDILNKSQVVKAIEDAGMYVGVGDYRPRYGRYVII